QDRVGEEFSGSVSSVVPFGLFVALDDIFIEGLIHISDPGSDYFHYDETRHELAGARTNRRYRLSDRVRVQVVRVDLETSKIDFRLIDSEEAAPTERRGKTARDRDNAAPLGDAAPTPRKGRGRSGSAASRAKAEAQTQGRATDKKPDADKPKSAGRKRGNSKKGARRG